jgi:hypothetical protein
MSEQEKKAVLEPQETPSPVAQQPNLSQADDGEAPDETLETNNHLAEKRGRMVAAGAITAVVLSLIAVIVAGVFQLTGTCLLRSCKDLPVNDPAPILWQDLTATKDTAGALGVPETLTSQTSLKTESRNQE